MKSKVTLKGNKKDGYILKVTDSLGFKEDMALTYEELVMLKALLKKIK